MSYYLPIFLMILISYFAFKNTKNIFLLVAKVLNLSLLLTLVYSIILGLYFKNYSMDEFSGEYPSAVMSRWSVILLLFVALPLAIAGIIYTKVFKKRRN